VAKINRHGLSRYIPANIRREVRSRSKFGCVVCRRGFYQYEHIDPPYEDAKEHDPDNICCLCGSCHDSVTRGHLSKKLINSAYLKIQKQRPEDVDPPVGPLDFHDGSAELAIGGLLYNPAVQNVLRYNGINLIRVIPGQQGKAGLISAVFTDERGNEVAKLIENEWVGSLDNWDIEVTGQQITVRRRQGEIALQLRLDPPGRVVVERLDMRVADSHILATEQTYAVGRYVSDDSVCWVHAEIHILKSSAFGTAIEFADVGLIEARDEYFRGSGKEMATGNQGTVYLLGIRG